MMRTNLSYMGLASLLIATFSCNSFKPDVDSIVKITSDRGTDIINFDETMWFDWDTMYWFPMNYSLDEVDLIININNFWKDVGDRIVFVKDDKIVYYKEYFPANEKPLQRICFEPDTFLVIYRGNAVFSIKKESEKLYVLHQMITE